MCDFEKQGTHLFIMIKTGFCVEFVRKNIYCGFWNTIVYVHDIIVRYDGPQFKHFRCTKSSGNLEILTSIYVGDVFRASSNFVPEQSERVYRGFEKSFNSRLSTGFFIENLTIYTTQANINSNASFCNTFFV